MLKIAANHPDFATAKTSATAPATKRYSVSLASTSSQIEDAQHLRYRIFYEELGVRTSNMKREIDVDEYDADCDHLLVRDLESLEIVGYYRIMRPETARKRGAYYSDSEFDLSRLHHLKSSTAEVGRACIHPDYRTGTVIMLLWSAIIQYMVKNHYDYVIGCASIPLNDGGANALATYQEVREKWLSPAEYRVFPKNPYPLHQLNVPNPLTPIRIPPLLKGYTRLGAWIGGEPAWDPDFNTADLFVMLPMARMSKQHARHFQNVSVPA